MPFELMKYSPAHVTLQKLLEHQRNEFDSRQYDEPDFPLNETDEALELLENKKELLQRLGNVHNILLLKYKNRLLNWAEDICDRDNLVPRDYGQPGAETFFAGTEYDEPLNFDYFAQILDFVDAFDDEEDEMDLEEQD